MTPEEIRTGTIEVDSAEWATAKWLREIAAQLAELNQRQQAIDDRAKSRAY